MSRIALDAEPPLARGRSYPERGDEPVPWYDELALQAYRRLWLPVARRVHRGRLLPIAHAAESHAVQLSALDDPSLQTHAQDLRARLCREGSEAGLVAECFAVIAEAAERTLGQRHRPCQFTAGWHLLNGRLIEMATGEGKTMAATLPAIVAAWSGRPVHVVTVNDYLAARDAQDLQPLYRFLGLSAGFVIDGMERRDRRSAYANPITYCSNKEVAFDYLRDRVAAGGHGSRLHKALDHIQRVGRAADTAPVLRGLVFAIVDEADSVFVDESRTPLILAANVSAADERGDFARALQIASTLAPQQDFLVELQGRNVLLLEAGTAKLAALSRGEGLWASQRAVAELVTQALRALHLYVLDKDYVVVDGKVQIVDESTGRAMPDRSWEQGLHQMIEVKEDCRLSDKRRTLARVTYQRFFRRYLHLAGMTGTAAEVAGEVKQVYGPEVRSVPLHRPMRRVRWADRVCLTFEDKWDAVAESVEQVALHAGRPVLIGTRSVKASQQLSERLQRRGIAHALLNARQDQDEAQIIAEAGRPGRVTVATNMAGRGTDIKLGPGVAARGGLHVILTEYHESTRIDRQLFGRCARQGDPGTCQAIVALDDELYRVHAPGAIRLATRVAALGQWSSRTALRAITALAQAAAERRNASARRQTLKADLRLEKMLAFSGRGQ